MKCTSTEPIEKAPLTAIVACMLVDQLVDSTGMEIVITLMLKFRHTCRYRKILYFKGLTKTYV